MLVKETENIQVYMYEVEIEHTGHVTNTYVIKDKNTNILAVIDPAFNSKEIKDSINKLGKLESVIVTHSHADHIAGLADLVNNENVKVYVHKLDKEGLWDSSLNEEEIVAVKVKTVNKENICMVEDKDVIKVGDIKLHIMHTPGHTIGSIILYNEQENVLFSGDTIFKDSYGRTDLITGNKDDMGISLNKIFDKFKDISIYPGHGEIFELENSKRRIRLLFAFKG